MTGRVRAKRLSLVGAEMQVRIEPDSKVTVFAGTNRQPVCHRIGGTAAAARRLRVAHSMHAESAAVPQPPARAA